MSGLDSIPTISFAGFNVWDEGHEEHLEASSPYAIRTFVTTETDSLSFAARIGGGYDPILGIYFTPSAYVRAPWLYVTNVGIVGIPVDGLTHDATLNVAQYKYSRVTVRYGRYKFDPTIITNGNLQLTFRQEIDTPKDVTGGVPKAVWQYDGGDDVPPDAQIPVRIPSGVLRITRYNCSSNGQALAKALGGRVNAAAFNGYDPETLYFDGTVSEKKITVGGANNWTLSFDLAWRSVGWNKFFDPTASPTGNDFTTCYKKVVLKLDGITTPYLKGDFTAFSGFL